MPPLRTNAPTITPATALALALLVALAAVGSQVSVMLSMAPGTVLAPDAQAAIASSHKSRSATSIGAALPPRVETGPGWETLSTEQKLALYPLAERWALVSEVQKRRWLNLAANFAALPEQEQFKFHDRMTDWAALSGQQRNQARLNFAVTNRLAGSDKRAQWEAYQALTDAEKRALAAGAAPKPKGAATALRPVSPKKLAQVPAATQSDPQRPNVPKILPPTDLPHRTIPAATPPTAAPHSAHLPTPGASPANPGTPSAMPTPTYAEPAPAESTAVHIPVAVPSALPPLLPADPDTHGGDTTAPVTPVTPDTSGLYPQ